MEDKILKQIQKIQQTLKRIQRDMATKQDLANHPTKKDLKRELDDLAGQITISADTHKVEKSEFEALGKRVDKIETVLQIQQ